MTTNATKPITSQKSIAKALHESRKGDRFEVKFVAVDNPFWIARRDDSVTPPRFSDAAWSDVPQAVLAAIVNGRSVLITIEQAKDVDGDTEIMTTIDGYENWMYINASFIRSLKVMPPVPKPTTHRVDGMPKDIVLHPEGHAVVGCQTITRRGLEQIHDLLTKHLGRG